MTEFQDFPDAMQSLMDHGRYLEVRTKAGELLKEHENLRISQLYALALSKSGAPEAARDYLEPIYKAHPEDAETAGILGSVYKELFRKTKQTSYAIQARDTYLKNFSLTKNYYTGINAASMSAIVMQSSKGKEIARSIVELIKPDSQNFWELATLGEACLLLKDQAASVRYYVQARKLAGADWGKISSAYNQLWLLNHYVPVSGEVMKIFTPPTVMAFVGHMVDHPNRPTPRFPPEIEKQVKEAIKANIRLHHAQIGYCSLACGSDILFAEAIAEEGGEVNVLLPFEVNDFTRISVGFAGQEWVQRFEALIKKFPATMVTYERYGGHDDLFGFQGKIILGSAVLRSATYHAEPVLLTVLSEVDLKNKEGGTRDTLHYWPFPKQRVNVNPEVFFDSASITKNPPVPVPSSEKIEMEARPVQHLMMINYSKMNVILQERLHRQINERIAEEGTRVTLMKESADSIILAFDFEAGIVEMIRMLFDMMKSPGSSNEIGITLHAGPAYKKEGIVEGESVNILREISHYSSVGVICSGLFAAVLALHHKIFSIEYAGMITGEVDQSVFKVSASE